MKQPMKKTELGRVHLVRPCEKSVVRSQSWNLARNQQPCFQRAYVQDELR